MTDQAHSTATLTKQRKLFRRSDPAVNCCRWIEGEPNGQDTIFCAEPVIGGPTLLSNSLCREHYLRSCARPVALEIGRAA